MNPDSLFRHSVCVKVEKAMQGPGFAGCLMSDWIGGPSGWSGRAQQLFWWCLEWVSGPLEREGQHKGEGGKKWGWDRYYRVRKEDVIWRYGRRKGKTVRSVRWRNNMASHWASLRLAPLRGSVRRQWAANYVLKVKPWGASGASSTRCSCALKHIWQALRKEPPQATRCDDRLFN